MTSWCGVPHIQLFWFFYLNPEEAGYVVMFCDFLITLVMFFGVIWMKQIIKLSEQEIEDNIINASDFTVMIKCENDKDETKDELRASYWNWVNDLMQTEPT